VLGPNGIEDATFHVHRAGCQDVAKQERKFLVDKHDIFDVVSEQELVEDLFMDFIGESPYGGVEGETTWMDYRDEVRFFGCTMGLALR
jgi:hypothetical protein